MQDEERALWDVYIQTGRTDIVIRNRLIESHYEWAKKLAFSACKKRGAGHAKSDEASANAVAMLIRLVERYDPTRDIPFRQYASTTIIGTAITALRDKYLFTGARRKSLTRKGVGLFSIDQANQFEDGRKYEIADNSDPSYKAESDEFWEWVKRTLGDTQYFRVIEEKYRMRTSHKELIEMFGRSTSSSLCVTARKKLAASLGREPGKGDKSLAHQRPVFCVDTGTKYPSGKEAERKTGIRQSNIWQSATRGYKAGGLRWRWA